MNREATLLLGAGPRALLMQIAHPLIAEGVDQHSDFRRDPWTRLRRTLRSYLTIVYGSGSTARAEIRRLNALHRSIAGPIRDRSAREAFGARYTARDPELGLWVHATLIDSVAVAHAAWISTPSADQRERFYQETRPIGRAFGIPDDLLPADAAAFERYLARMLGPDGPVHPNDESRALAPFVLSPSLGPLAPGPVAPLLDRIPHRAYDWLYWPALSLLPEDLRAELGIAWTPRRAAVAAWLTSGFRAWRPLFPPALRIFPIAARAEARARGAAARRTTRAA